MYKIAQNFPVIVKQPLFNSTHLLKITQGSLYFCTKVNLHESANEFETEELKHETKVSKKKESGKNIEENTPPVIYLSETPTSSYPLESCNNVNPSNPFQTDSNFTKIAKIIEPKHEIIYLQDNSDNFLKESCESLLEKPSSSILHKTKSSSNEDENKNVEKPELIQNEKKKWEWNEHQKTDSLDPNILSKESLIFSNRKNNETKTENVNTLNQNPVPQFEAVPSNIYQNLIRLEPYKTEILSSKVVKSTRKEWSQQYSDKLKPFTPPAKGDNKSSNYIIFDKNKLHSNESKEIKDLVPKNCNTRFKKALPIPKIKARNPFRLQNAITFKGKSSPVPINPNITFTKPVQTLGENHLVNPVTGQNFIQKMIYDRLLRSKNVQQNINDVDPTHINNDNKSGLLPIPQNKMDAKFTTETKIPFFPSPNPEINKVPNRTIALNADNFYKNLFSASTSTSSNKISSTAPSNKPTAGALSSKIATAAASFKTSNTALPNKINITPSSKIITATIATPDKTTSTVAVPNKIITASINPPQITGTKIALQATTATPTIKLISSPNKTIPLETQQTNNQVKIGQKNAISPETLQNNLKPSNSVQFQIPGRLLIAFTCKKCNTRNSKKISKHAYTKGVVIIRCDGCNNNHLIADNLNWFSDMGKKRNIEDIMAEKGEKVRKIDLPGGISEYLTES